MDSTPKYSIKDDMLLSIEINKDYYLRLFNCLNLMLENSSDPVSMSERCLRLESKDDNDYLFQTIFMLINTINEVAKKEGVFVKESD